MPAGRVMQGPRGSKGVQKVQVVKPKRRKRGPKIQTNLLRKKQTVKMNYADTISLTPGVAAVTSHAFRCNGIWDPDYSGVGHQPLLHDEYAGLYDEFRVISSKIRVTPVASGASTQVPAFWGVYVDPDILFGYSSSTQVIEDKGRTGRAGIHSGIQTVLYNARTGKGMTRTFNARRHLSKEGANAAHTMGTNPALGTEDAYFRVWAGSILGNDPGTIEFLIEIEYVVEFTEPLTVTPS